MITFQSIGRQIIRCNNNNGNENNKIHNINDNNNTTTNNKNNDNVSATVNARKPAAPTGATDHAIAKYKFFECLSYREHPDLRRTHRCDKSRYS